MRPKISYITIAVSDLKKSADFYKNGFGFKTKGIQEDNYDYCMFEPDDDFSLVLYLRQEFLHLTANPNQIEKSTGFILSHNGQSKQQVDEILQFALKVGATQIG